ncbi:uncharacterized protein METZ01_LOCUS272590 [marine metagenome]|uniref:Uncharacterized protein n=1 Tax=marine metagenome TaxID=408172 RepID=A0A382K6T1_9ZZZZ
MLLYSPVIGDNNKGETLYAWGEYIPFVWKGFGDKETHPKYTGDVKNGKPDGQGTETFPDGSKYIGEWIAGKPTGQGTQTYYDGDKYVGLFKDGKYHGQGTYTFSYGGKFVGEFKDDNRWNGIRYDKNGNIIYKVVNGK